MTHLLVEAWRRRASGWTRVAALDDASNGAVPPDVDGSDDRIADRIVVRFAAPGATLPGAPLAALAFDVLSEGSKIRFEKKNQALVEVVVTAQVRNFLQAGKDQRIELFFRVKAVVGAPTRELQPYKLRFHGGSSEIAHNVGPSSLLASAKPFKTESDGAWQAPEIKEALGLKNVKTKDCGVRFARVGAHGVVTRFVPEFRATLDSIAKDAQLTLGPLRVACDDELRIAQRLWIPHEDDREYPEARAPWGRWLFEIEDVCDDAALVEFWNERVERAHLQALRAVLDDQPVSVVPGLSSSKEVEGAWHAYFVALDPGSKADEHGEPLQKWWSEGATAESACLRPLGLYRMPGEDANDARDARARFFGLKTWSGRALTYGIRFVGVPLGPQEEWWRDVYSQAWSPQHVELRLAFELHSVEYPGVEAEGVLDETHRHVRLGAVDLGFETRVETADFLVHFAHTGDDALPRLAEAKVHLPLESFRAAGQDPRPRERLVEDQEGLEPPTKDEVAPLVIPLPGEGVLAGKLVLAADERTEIGNRQTLSFAVNAVTTGDSASDVPLQGSSLILDTAPFLVAGVQWQASTSLVTGEKALAEWSSASPDGVLWRIRTLGKPMSLWLPAQTIGESMERSKRPGEGIPPGERADLRLGPAAEILFSSEDLPRQFAEVPWNLRRLLERAGEGRPGVKSERLRLELLYGIHVDAPTTGLRIAESFARMGSIPGRLPEGLAWKATAGQEKVYRDYRASWASMISRYARRLAVLELVDPDAEEAGPVERGVNARLRLDSLRKTTRLPYAPNSSDDKDKLAGGALWGLESRAIFEAVTRDPDAVGARLERVRLSALGGWGEQSVAFDEGRTVIRSTTSMGRAARIQYERIGRIGVFWNRAKHVVVYERTTAPSRQFCRDQTPHLGRPLLRKVQEYVELLQERRDYPDLVSGGDERGKSTLELGPVRACAFVTRRIPVDSHWGSDVIPLGQTAPVGWRVPLWRNPLLFPDVDPQVYPKPVIVLDVATDGAAPDDEAPAPIRDPDQLWFFTDTREGSGSDTDVWAAVVGIDFTDEPTPAPEEESVGDGHDLDRPVGDAPSIPAGFGDFTFAVLSSRRPANLVAGRADRAMGAVLENVTMMRASPRARKPATRWEVDELSSNWLKLREAIPRAGRPSVQDVARLERIVDAWIKKVDDATSLPTKVLGKVPSRKDLCDGVKQRMGGIAEQVPAQMRRFVEDLQVRVLREVDLALQTTAVTKERVKNALDRAHDLAVDALGRVGQSVATASRQVSAGMDDALAAVRAFRIAYDEEVARLRREVERLAQTPAEFEREWRRFLEADPLQRVQDRLLAATQRLVDTLRARLEGGFSKVTNDVRERLLEHVERPILAHLERLRTLVDLTAVRAEVERLEWLLGQTVIQSAQSIADLRKPVDDVFDRARPLSDGLRTAAADARSAVQEVLDAQGDATAVKAVLERIKVRSSWVKRRVEAALDALGAFLARAVPTKTAFDDLSRKLLEQFAALSSKIDTAIADLDTKPVAEVKAALESAADLVLTTLNGALGVFDASLSSLRGDFDAKWKVARDMVDALVPKVRAFEAEAHRFVATAFDTVDQARDAVVAAQDALTKGVRDADTAVREELAKVETTIGSFSAQAVTGARRILDGTIERWASPFEQALKTALDDLGTSTIPAVQRAFAGASDVIDTAFRKGDEALADLEQLLIQSLERLRSTARSVSDRLDPVMAHIVMAVDALHDELEREVDALDLATIRSAIASLLQAFVKDWNDRIAKLDGIRKHVEDDVVDKLCDLLPDPHALVDPVANELKQRLKDELKILRGSIKGFESARRLRDELEARFRRLEREVGPTLRAVRRAADGAIDQATVLYQHGSETLRLLRAFGETPIVPDLRFNRERIGYYFAHPDRIVETTPMVALANRVGDELKAMGLRVPTRQLLDQVVPDRLRDFDLSSILPDFGGLKLDGLFGGLRFPAVPSKNVRITHGLDRESLRAWLEATADLEMREPSTVFSLGALAMSIQGARFRAHVRVEADPQGVQRRRSNGEILANWLLRVGGRPVVTFEKTRLAIDESGRVRFELSPSSVKLHPPLDFISDALAKLTQPGNGLTLRRVQGPGVIAGAEAVLALPLPDVQAGAFALTGLVLGSSFGLVVTRGERGIDFALSASVNVATKARPFALTIAFLSGGGWFDVRATYWPRRREMAALLSVGIHAGARFGLSLGPVSGAVYMRFGIAVEFSVGGRQGNGLTITVFLALGGEAQVLGFISVAIDLLLEASYGNGRMVGRGSLSLRVRICWCFTFKFETSVEYVFAGKSGGAELAAMAVDDPYLEPARDYVGLFEGAAT